MKKTKDNEEEEKLAILYTLQGKIDVPVEVTTNLSTGDIDTIIEDLSVDDLTKFLSILLLRENELTDRK